MHVANSSGIKCSANYTVDAGLVDHVTMAGSAEHVALELAKEISEVRTVHATPWCKIEKRLVRSVNSSCCCDCIKIYF